MPATASPNAAILKMIAKKNRLRLIMAMIVMSLYFGFALGYSSLQDLFASKIGDSLIPFGMVYFVSLIISFIAIEMLYLKLAKQYDLSKAEVSHYAK